MRTALLLLLSCAPAVAQSGKDLRDAVRMTNGREVHGRVLTPFATDELVVRQGGKRVRIPIERVAAMETVNDRLREFLDLRARDKANPAHSWILVEWADSHDLPEMARLQAIDLVLRDDDHQKAHEFLGHKRTRKGWLWEHRGKHMGVSDLEEHIVKWGRAMELESEHWRMRFNGGIRQAVDALFDLEHLYLFWMNEYGVQLQLQEVLEPMDLHVWRDPSQFPKWGQRPMPYFVPEPFGDIGKSFYDGIAPKRPERLFFLGTQQIIYHSLAPDARVANDRTRLCSWLEIGLGMYAENRFGGDAGYAEAGEAKYPDVQALQAMARRFDIKHLIHLPMYASFYLEDAPQTVMNWGAATMFASYLLDPDNKPATREKFLEYVRLAIQAGKGDSSTLFDDAMGKKLEDFDRGWRRWLEQKAGF